MFISERGNKHKCYDQCIVIMGLQVLCLLMIPIWTEMCCGTSGEYISSVIGIEMSNQHKRYGQDAVISSLWVLCLFMSPIRT